MPAFCAKVVDCAIRLGAPYSKKTGTAECWKSATSWVRSHPVQGRGETEAKTASQHVGQTPLEEPIFPTVPSVPGIQSIFSPGMPLWKEARMPLFLNTPGPRGAYLGTSVCGCSGR